MKRVQGDDVVTLNRGINRNMEDLSEGTHLQQSSGLRSGCFARFYSSTVGGDELQHQRIDSKRLPSRPVRSTLHVKFNPGLAWSEYRCGHPRVHPAPDPNIQRN